MNTWIIVAVIIILVIIVLNPMQQSGGNAIICNEGRCLNCQGDGRSTRVRRCRKDLVCFNRAVGVSQCITLKDATRRALRWVTPSCGGIFRTACRRPSYVVNPRATARANCARNGQRSRGCVCTASSHCARGLGCEGNRCVTEQAIATYQKALEEF